MAIRIPRQSRPQHEWYDRRWWKKISRRQRELQPLCEMCLKRGLVRIAEVADHIEPVNGDPHRFRFGKLQSLCRPCHEGTKQVIESRGYETAIGPDGYPVDREHHPAYTGVLPPAPGAKPPALVQWRDTRRRQPQ
jgi:hypothetical protein